jgi:predicted nucleotidyltransferase component of viral defense system
VTSRPPVNVAASAFDRLKQRTRRSGEDFNVILLRYAGERLLYRLAQSSHSESFALKGATLFALWEDDPHRQTRDIDLLGFGVDSAERLRAAFADVCVLAVADDGMVFDPASVVVGDIREEQAYGGKRVLVDCRLGNARLRVQVDVGFGDRLAQPCDQATLPALLDFPAPRLLVYPVEAVIAEKLHALAQHGVLTSRMKDMYDIVALAERLKFDGADLIAAIRATFESRGGPAGEVPSPITPAFADDVGAVTRWGAFMRRNRLGTLDLATTVDRARAFLLEPLVALREGKAFAKRWSKGGPWR